MRGRLSIMLMLFVALALVLSLVSAVATNVSAQDSATLSDGPGKWMRYNMPAAQDWEATTSANKPIAEPRNCCITVTGPYPQTITPTNPCSLNGFERANRWFCVQYYQ